MIGRQPSTTRGRLSRRSTAAGLLVAGLLVALPAVPASAATTDGWTAALGDSGNAATNPGETAITAATASRVGAAWSTTDASGSPYAPPVVDGVALRVISPGGNVYSTSYLTWTSPTTGVAASRVPLPTGRQYYSGVTVAGSYAVIPFNGFNGPGGVLAVDLRTKSVAWSSDLPAASLSWMGNAQAGPAYTDGQRVFVSGAGNAVNAYRLGDGARLWTLPLATDATGRPTGVDGLAVGNGAVFTAGEEGLVAYDAATGRRLWTGQGGGRMRPVVAGGRVFVPAYGAVRAYPAAGCGTATCAPTWTTTFPQLNPNTLEVGGADSSTLFVTYYSNELGGVVTRLSAGTGAKQWSAPVDRAAIGLVRAGNTIWMNSEYVKPSGEVAQQIVGFSTTATGPTPLRRIPLTSDLAGFPQTLGVAAGTLFQQLNAGILVGYRVAATVPTNAAPVASFTTSVSGLSVLVDGSGSRDPDGQVTTYEWDFGDGTTGWGNPSAITYARAGTYPITLKVTDGAGASATTTTTVTVDAPVPPAPTPSAFVTDTFRRTVTGGLGKADVGGAWTASAGASRQSVASGTATLALAPGASTGAYLGSTPQPGADLTATVSLNGIPGGSGAYYSLIGRRTGQNREYRLQTRFAADGTLRLSVLVLDSSATERRLGAETVVPGVRYAARTPVHLRFRVTGSGTTTLQAKAWAGSTEPAGWTVSRSDATASVQGRGQVGMTSYLSSGATSRSLAFAVTGFSARTVS